MRKMEAMKGKGGFPGMRVGAWHGKADALLFTGPSPVCRAP